MSILNYFKWKRKEALLPDHKGPLLNEVPKSPREVLKVLSDDGTIKKKTTYIKVDGDYKAGVAKYALEHGNCAAVRKYSNELKENLNESTVHSWVTKYKEEWSKKEGDESNPEVNFIPSAKQGRLLLIGETLDNQVKAYIRMVHGCGGPIFIIIVIAVGKAVVRKFDVNLLSEHDGPLSLTPNWAKSILYRMNFVERKGCLTAKPMVHA